MTRRRAKDSRPHVTGKGDHWAISTSRQPAVSSPLPTRGNSNAKCASWAKGFNRLAQVVRHVPLTARVAACLLAMRITNTK